MLRCATPAVLAALLGASAGVFWGALSCADAAGAPKAKGPLSPREALQAFVRADESLIVELVAAEPDVVSPVALAWDENGRLFVAEMRDYPLGPGSGQIRLLEDGDGDGVHERIGVFADKLPFPTSVLPWKGGILVTAAPNIWYLKDTDGDGKADERIIVLTGFNEGNQQLRVNGLFWGLDNWIYGANGRSDGEVRRPKDAPGQAVSIRRRDFRFRPESGAVEAVAGPSQFGLARDDWGDRFLSWNTIPLRQVVFEERYLSRNPALRASSIAYTADPADSGRLFRLSPPPRTFNNESVDFPNASCGVTIHRGDLLGEDYRGNAFVCEPLLNLVHRRTLIPGGPAVGARRGEQGKEFLASTDSWFHPVNLATGPDGALYIVDFYREMVVPESIRAKIDFRVGGEHGRIWRVRRRDAKPGAGPRLGDASREQLMAHLGHSNGWWRDTAQRLFVERGDAQAVPLLAETVRQGKTPQAQVHALWTLQGLDAVKEEWLVAALRDRQPRVREHALKLCEGRIAKAPALTKAAAALADDPDARVRFQLAILLGEAPGPDALQALAAIAQRDQADAWTRLAVLNSLAGDPWAFTASLVERHRDWLKTPTAEQTQFLMDLGGLVGGQQRPQELTACLELLTRNEPASAAGQMALLAGLGDGLARVKRPLRLLMAQPPLELHKPLGALPAVFRAARRLAGAEQEAIHLRVAAIRVLAHGNPETEGGRLLEMLQPQHPVALQSAAAQGVGEMSSPALAAQALEPWTTYAVATRRELMAALLRSAKLAAVLLAAVEGGNLAARELDAATRQALLSFPSPDVQKRARTILASGVSNDRRSVVSKYGRALELDGDARRGAILFEQQCASCHQLQGMGHRVGPDVSGVGSRPRETLLVDLLDPSREVAPDHVNYLLITTRGQVLTGLLAAEGAASVTIRRAGGAEDTVPRADVQELRATRKSLMPEGFEQTLKRPGRR
jgi:putative membrane-bound dehydrogenase-like protein